MLAAPYGLAIHDSQAASANDAPYGGKIVRLAQILGSLHYLRNLCGETGTQWRDQMDKILDSEKPNEQERTRLVQAFNQGYESFAENYTECTPSAHTAISRYMIEGETISKDLVSRYGN